MAGSLVRRRAAHRPAGEDPVHRASPRYTAHRPRAGLATDSDNVFITALSTPSGSPSVPITVSLAMPGPDSRTTYPTTVGAAGGTTRAALAKALSEAIGLGHSYIGTGHPLLGVLHPDSDASAALATAGVTLDAARDTFGRSSRRSCATAPLDPVPAHDRRPPADRQPGQPA